jgi:hypothetical protein
VKILDLTPGKRGIWFDKNHPMVTFADSLPVAGEGYNLIVFDPPHVNVGKGSNMSKDYGHHTSEEIRQFVLDAALEAHRVSVPNALMAFKWNDHDWKLDKVLAFLGPWWEPLFGQKTAIRSKHASSTYWVLLLRRSDNGMAMS